MTKQIIINLIFLFTLTILHSCGNDSTDSDFSYEYAKYEILSTEPFESGEKAQVKCYAYLTTDSITKDKLTGTLKKIYSELEKYNNFRNFSAPNVIAIYLFISKDKAQNMKESWIAMLSKSPSTDNLPQYSFNEMQVNAFSGLKDNVKSEEELKMAKLNETFKNRGTDICTIYKTLYDLEGYTIKQADIKYPDYGFEHSEYQKKLYKQEKEKLFKKFDINDSLSSSITFYGMSYCK